MKVENIQTIYGLNGFIMDSISFSSESVKIFYHRDRRRSMICPVCGRAMWKNRTVIREFYDLAMGPVPTVRICIETAQGKCSKCGAYKTFLPDEVTESATATQRLQYFAYHLCYMISPAEASRILPFSDDTIRRWDQNILQKEIGKINLDNVQHILIDEKSIGKHHHYVTLVLDRDTGELLYMNPGKGYNSIKPFFEQMSQKQRGNIQTACMDRNASYPKAVKEFCPQAVIIYDKFHIVKNLNDALDLVRREETSKAIREDKPIIKGERFNLLRHRENLTISQRRSLDELLLLNKSISAAYILKESFRQFWICENLAQAEQFLKHWTTQVLEGNLKPLMRFAQGLLGDKSALLASLQFGFTNAALERFNGTVARIIARGFGYRNKEYLFLKLRQQSMKKINYLSANLR